MGAIDDLVSDLVLGRDLFDGGVDDDTNLARKAIMTGLKCVNAQVRRLPHREPGARGYPGNGVGG